MRKQLIAAAGLAILAVPAVHASKARVTALGSGETGDFHYADQRGMFYNPAYLNQYNNFVIVEFGTDRTDETASGTGATNAGATDNNSSNAEAEGGFARKTGDFVYSLYFGRDKILTADGSANDADGATQTGFLQENNRVELSLAGDAGVQWGVTLWRSANEDASSATVKKEQDSMGLRGGVLAGAVDVGVELDFGGDHKGADHSGDKLEKEFGWLVDATYTWQDWAFHIDYVKADSKETNNGVTATEERSKSAWNLGAGHKKSVSSSSSVLWKVTYGMNTEEYKTTNVTNETEVATLPVVVGFESTATDWLTLRGSVSQNLMDSKETKTSTSTLEDKNVAGTAVAAGLSLTFGKLIVDGTITTSSTTGTYALGTDTMSNVAVHYWF